MLSPRAVLVVTIVLGCAPPPMGQPELVFTARPSSINDQGEEATLELIATDPAGKIGQGNVLVTGGIGRFENGDTLTLDAFGKASAVYSCKSTDNPACVGQATFTAEWVYQGKKIKATTRVSVLRPPTPWEDSVTWDPSARTASCSNMTMPDPVACTSGSCARGFTCASGRCVLNGGSGGLQYTLRFGQSVDLDLHVVEPPHADGGTCEVYWQDPNRAPMPSMCGSVSSLDLDSNAGCRLDNVNIENVIFPVSGRPAAGTYLARIDLFDSCSATTPIKWELEVRAGGAHRFYCGEFNPALADHGGRGSGVEVSRIVVPPP